MTKFQQFLKNTKANVAITFAIAIVVFLLSVGAAVDYGNIVMTKSALQGTLDAANLAGAAAIRDKMAAGSSFAAAKSYGTSAANATFTQDWSDSGTPQVTYNFTNVGINVVATATAVDTIQNSFMSIAGMPTQTITASSEVTVTTTPYRNVYLLVDISTSMLLPSTQAGINQMISGTGCALACHDGSNSDSYSWAKSKGITLRYQDINTGVGSLMDYIDSDTSLQSHTTVGLWSFDSVLTNNVPLTTNHQSVKTNFPSPAIAVNNAASATPFSTYINNFISAVGTGGDGSSTSSPQKVVFIATDGVNDPTRDWTWNTPLQAQVKVFDTSFCQTLKNNNVTVAIINTPYYPMTWDWGYNATLGQPGTLGGATRVDDIPIALQACAGNLFLIASDQAAMQTGFQTLFQQLGAIRLSK